MGVIAVVGPTASAKSGLAMRLAADLGGELVSVDSMQVYRELDIGTAKPSPHDRESVPHHVIDVVDPEHSFTVAEHQALGLTAVDEIAARDRIPIVVGGSGLHYRSIVDPLEFPPSDSQVRAEIETLEPADAVLELLAADSEAASVVDLANARRVARALEIHRLTGDTPSQRAASTTAIAVRNYEPRLPLLAVGMDPGDELAARVESRFDAMLDAGLLAEVEQLADRLGITAAQGVGYKELVPVVRGLATLEDGRDAAIRATKALAKRQRTFFRRDPRIRWIPWDTDSDNLDRATRIAQDFIRETPWIS